MISIYRLNADGTVPDYVVDGGYFPNATNGTPPQDWELVGVTTAEAPGTPFANVAALEAYLVSIGGEAWTDPLGAQVDLAALAATMWGRQ